MHPLEGNNESWSEAGRVEGRAGEVMGEERKGEVKQGDGDRDGE